jgi:2-hydroxychromene-2-carboxylate isomerase
MIWSGEVDAWHEGDHLAEAVAAAGGDLAEMDQVIDAEAERLDAAIKQSEADQRLGGHYGVPLMVYDGEPFFGQDRYEQLVWRMQQKGMVARA